MKTIKTMNVAAIALASVMFVFASCKKENSITSDEANSIQAAVVAQQAIAVTASTTTSGDSIYLVQTCSRGSRKDSVAASSLPASVTAYLTANYSGYAFGKAFSIKDASGTAAGYVVVINYNGNPVGLKFDATGAFVSVLEQREGRDLIGNGWHNGGHFGHRDGKQKDTVALSALPAAMLTYLATNAAGDTLTAAFKNRDGGIVVISRNNGLYATVFTAAGTFVSRAQLPSHPAKPLPVLQTALPASALSYLTTTYPNYVFSKAFSYGSNSVIGYVVIIEANSTRYAVKFDASGNFLAAKTIH